MGHIRSWTNAPVKLISIIENIVLSISPEGLRCHIGLVVVLVQQVQKWHAALGWETPRAINPGQPMRKLAQPVPNTGGAPGDLGFKSALLAAFFFLFAVLGSLHDAFICAYWKLAT